MRKLTLTLEAKVFPLAALQERFVVDDILLLFQAFSAVLITIGIISIASAGFISVEEFLMNGPALVLFFATSINFPWQLDT